MKSSPSKRIARIEKKKKKMAALLEISKLNEYDRAVKNAQITKSEADSGSTDLNINLEPSPKRQRTESDKQINLVTSPTPPQLLRNSGPACKVKLSGDEYIALKKLLRERTTKMRQHPLLRLRDVGENASLTVEFDSRIPIFLSDLQHLIMYSQVGVHSPYSPARWCSLEKYNRLVNTVILVVENISLYQYTAYESQFTFIKENFDYKLEILNPTTYKSDIVKELSMVPLTGTQMRKFINEYGTLEKAVLESSDLFDMMKNMFPIEEPAVNHNNKDLPPTDKFSRIQLLLSGWQMVEENFPLPIKGLMERKYGGYVLTKDKYKPVTAFSPMFGIDCEMCKTQIGDLELTRISVVDEKLEVFYDTLVKPKNKIVDYLTRYSGITAKMMKNVTKCLQDVQNDLKRMLPADAILVGQSLSNDMHALKMMHPYVIDTSVIFNITGDRTRKTRLQTLAREFLSERIQEGNKGHCSQEDSAASLKLVQLKLSKSLYFGDAVMGSFKNEVKVYPDLASTDYATSMLKQATKVDHKATVIGFGDSALRYKYYVDKGSDTEDKNIKFYLERSNNEVISKMCQLSRDNNLTIGHTVIHESQFDSEHDIITKNIDCWVADIHANINAPALLCVILGGQVTGSNGCCFIKIKRAY